jgi:signal transduction histidine kinase
MIGSRLHVRLQVAMILSTASTFAVLALLAPGVLLLEPGVASAVLEESAWTFPTILVIGALTTVIVVRALGPALRALELGEGDAPGIDSRFVRRLHALPVLWVVKLGIQAIFVWSLSLIPGVRPSVIDRETQISLVLLTTTVVGATTLPLYVAARALVAQTMEAVPWRIAEAAMRDDEPIAFGSLPRKILQFVSGRSQSRVRGRLANAVMLAVAIVAFGALLLVDAHVRAFEARHRRDDAYALARGVLEPVAGSGGAGRQAAIRVAEQRGYHVELAKLDGEGDDAPNASELGQGGVRTSRTRLEDTVATIRFQPTIGGSGLAPYVIVAALAIALAALVGRVIGLAVARDLSGAAREIRLLGTADVLRGVTRVAGPARFSEVAELGQGVEEVAERFREFARGRERMIEARESAQRMRDLFLASMSHDLRSPLNGILGFVELLRKHGLKPAQLESLAIIDRRGRELLELIENILDAAKIEAGRLELSRDWIAPAEILANAVRRGRELALEKGGIVEVRGELQSGLPPLWIDGPRITQAVINLVTNAVKYCDRGVVRVRIARGRRDEAPPSSTPEPGGAEGIRIEVEDQGRGIPEKDLAQIFDAFRQPIRARRHGGLGLGLTMTRALVELHDGTIDVASSPERGSAFTLFVPFARPPADVAARGPLWRLPTPVPGSRPPFEIVEEQAEEPAARSVHEDPTVQMPALEIPPETTDHGTGSAPQKIAPRVETPPSLPSAHSSIPSEPSIPNLRPGPPSSAVERTKTPAPFVVPPEAFRTPAPRPVSPWLAGTPPEGSRSFEEEPMRASMKDRLRAALDADVPRPPPLSNPPPRPPPSRAPTSTRTNTPPPPSRTSAPPPPPSRTSAPPPPPSRAALGARPTPPRPAPLASRPPPAAPGPSSRAPSLPPRPSVRPTPSIPPSEAAPESSRERDSDEW